MKLHTTVLAHILSIPCTSLQCYFLQSHIYRMLECLAVTWHMHGGGMLKRRSTQKDVPGEKMLMLGIEPGACTTQRNACMKLCHNIYRNLFPHIIGLILSTKNISLLTTITRSLFPQSCLHPSPHSSPLPPFLHHLCQVQWACDCLHGVKTRYTNGQWRWC